jgi:D-inositol-3-phosphate glycosyltransferase
MVKVLMLANHFLAHGGGVEVMADQLARFLCRHQGMTVTLMAHGDPGPCEDYRAVRLSRSNFAERVTGLPLLLPNLHDLATIKSEVATSDIVVLHDNLYLSHLFAQRAALGAKVPVLLIKHTGSVFGPRLVQRLAQKAMRAAVVGPSLRTATGIVAVTEPKRAALLPLVFGKPIEVIENGIDTDFFTPGSLSRDVDVLFVGRFVPKKGIGLVRELASGHPDLRFLCVGFGPVDPAGWQLPNVEVWWRPAPKRIREAYRRARMTIVPAISEGMPLVVAESLACGTPVLASALARHPILPDSQPLPATMHWDAQSTQRWARALTQQLAGHPNADALHEAARRTFGFEAAGRRYTQIIHRMLEGALKS